MKEGDTGLCAEGERLRIMRNREVEILAPGGSVEGIYSAFAAGADAVYTGTSKFSARAYAKNPSVEELCDLLDYAHFCDKKIYLTLNTLLNDTEIGQIENLVAPLYEYGLDGIIVQDFGVVNYLAEHFPDLNIHGSTQMTVLNGEACQVLHPAITRIVPSRELTIEEIRAFRKATDLELEVFVHGALCYCYSGQCRMSEVIGGRSGNRGMCAQPCRLPMVADGRRGHLLSTRDLCGLADIGQLIDAGVCSFKIEGRMKSPTYAALASYMYRKYSDIHLAGEKPNKVEMADDMRKLADVYNRGEFTKGFLFGGKDIKKSLVYPKVNGHFGVKVGKVTKVSEGKNLATIKLEKDVYPQDVLELRDDAQNKEYDYTLGAGSKAGEEINARFTKGLRVRAGMGVYRTKNNSLIDEVTTAVENARTKKLAEVKVTSKVGEEVRVEFSCGEKSVVETGQIVEVAGKRPVTAEDIEKRIRKTGETKFEIGEAEFDVESGIFLPLGEINKLRRKGLEELEKLIVSDYHRELPEGKEDEVAELLEGEFVMVSFKKMAQYEEFADSLREDIKVCIYLDDFPNSGEWGKLGDILRDREYYVAFPRILKGDNREKFMREWRSQGHAFDGKSGVIASTIQGLELYQNLGEKGELVIGSGLYVTNRRAWETYAKLGAKKHSFIAYGKRPVMLTEGCLFATLSESCGGENRCKEIELPKRDRFIVERNCKYCYNIIYERESEEYETDEICNMSELQFTFESDEEIRKVLNRWNCL